MVGYFCYKLIEYNMRAISGIELLDESKLDLFAHHGKLDPLN